MDTTNDIGISAEQVELCGEVSNSEDNMQDEMNRLLHSIQHFKHNCFNLGHHQHFVGMCARYVWLDNKMQMQKSASVSNS